MKKFFHLCKRIQIVVLLFMQDLKHHCVPVYAAQAAFYIMLSIFPFLMFLLTMIQYLPITEQDLLTMIDQGLPSAVAPFLSSIISEIYATSSTTVVSITAISTLWAASKAFYALSCGLNSVYEAQEQRNYLWLRLRATLHTFLFTFLLLATLVLLVFGNSIAHGIRKKLPVFEDTALLVISIRASASICILILFFLYLYVIIPNRRSRILAEIPGAVATSTGWLVFSYAYSFYIDQMPNIANTYGSLTAIVLLMLWLYFCMYMLLLGGEINTAVKQRKKWADAFYHPEDAARQLDKYKLNHPDSITENSTPL